MTDPLSVFKYRTRHFGNEALEVKCLSNDSLGRRQGQFRHDGDEAFADQLTTRNQRPRSVPASPKRVPSGPQDPFGGRNSAVSDPIPARVRQIVGLVRRNGGTIALKWPGDGAGEGQMGNVGLRKETEQ